MFEDENGHRPGDWTHRGQRSRAKADEPAKDPNGKKWYQETFWIVALLILLWPVGLVLAWRSEWPLAAKIVATALVLAYTGFIIYKLPALMEISNVMQASLAAR